MTLLEHIREPHDRKHQSYVHKLLTGRQDFSKLRAKGGLSGYPSRLATLRTTDGYERAPSWMSVFGDEMVRIGAEREDVVALTAAMLEPVQAGGVDVLHRVPHPDVLLVAVGTMAPVCLRVADVDVPLRTFGILEQFLPHAKRGELLADLGLTPAEIAGRISGALARKESTS